ncbi:MarR family winged helix-turn-helix transcriptional regulator [Terrisporobacter mayombei]|uniref:HTH-type transcriptional regulator SarZ n=1 Tax=Terrisporobacter mayombei TaxID=1541 RepID=A0ABY9PXB8_9FIRM|nr:MarR family winged helix-turn-helix transcriptional regulator [Terrisporobacter mayombei]MCC3868190.1 MarR family winged helix-turn-helix transcriptional regulator [Terrisporobacter mayombei]WMT80330.1 HTH-type transcriptional regulator MhqR [Terrisporobacter mayombei]
MTELKIFIGMSRALNKINRATNKVYTKYGLTSAQFAVLEALYHKGDLSVGEVQDKILSTSGTIPVIVKNLEKEGFLEKRNDDNDKRRFILHITQKGRELMDIVYPENEAIIVSMMNIWNKEEQEEILKYMKKFGGVEDEKNDKK